MSECQRGEPGLPHQGSGVWRINLPEGYRPLTVKVNVTDQQAIKSFTVYVCGNPWKCWVFLRLLTGDGLEGVGECSLNGFAKTTVACIEELSRYFLGKRPEQYATITHRMLTELYSDAGQLHRGVIAAVEMACLDILGKRVGLPVYALLGGKVRDEIPAYANGWYRVERSPEGFAEAAVKAEAMGYRALKCDPFGASQSPLSDEDRGKVWGIIQALNKASPISYALEAHQRLDALDAQWAAQVCLNRQWMWFEEPLPWWNLSGMLHLATWSIVPIATGENLTSVRQFEDLASRSNNLILQPDVMFLGGITKAMEVCRLVERHGLLVCPHDAQGPVSRACCVQLAALSPAVWMLEDFDPWNAPWTQEIATTFRAKYGRIGFTDMPPGLGVTIHWDKVREHPYAPNGWVPLFETGWEKRRSDEP